MVSTTSSMMTHGQEGDRKRKQTMERAKAHHLCRELQMRLQYARLKVEHGWQKQSLNEVENLYFHHSYQRGPKPLQSNVVATTAQPERAAFAHPTNPQSSLSFISRSAGAHINITCAPPNTSESTAQMLPPSTTPTPNTVDKTPPDTHPHSSLPPPTSPQRPSTALHALQSPVNITSSPQSQQTSNAFSSSSTPRYSEHPTSDAPSPLPPILMSPSKSRTRSAKSHPASPDNSNHTATKSSIPISSSNPFNFGAMQTSGLTYDAFWSSHSTAASPRNSIVRTNGFLLSAHTPVAGPGQQAQV